MKFRSRNGEESFSIIDLMSGHLPLLESFGNLLGESSKNLFCPYPWGNDKKLKEAFGQAILNSVVGVDSSFLILDDKNEPAGHFFLWKTGGNRLSREFGVEVPELGVAIVDRHQRKGLGEYAVSFLQHLARKQRRDAIELTTALDNNAGWGTYLRAGFEYVGNISNPLEVDVTEVFAGRVTASKFREERQMVCILNEMHRSQVLEYLAHKRAQPK